MYFFKLAVYLKGLFQQQTAYEAQPAANARSPEVSDTETSYSRNILQRTVFPGLQAVPF